MRTLIPEYEPLLEDVVNGEPPSLTFKAEEACGEYINIAFRLMRACHEHPAFVRRVLKYVEMDGVDAAMALILAMWFMQKEDGNYVTCYPYEFPLFNASIPHPVISTYILDFLSYQHFTGIGGRKLIQDNWSRRPMFNQVDTVMLGTTYQNIYTHLRKQLTAGDVLAPGFITEFVEAMIKGGGDIVDLVARYHRAA
jgi:hypothetical protein